MPSRRPRGARTLALVLPGVIAAYGAWALLARGRWIAPAAALVVAGLLLLRHRRARFAAYVFLSAAAVRAAAQGPWVVLAGAALAVAALQTPAAGLLWPRLTPRWRRGAGGSRMTAP